jgi:hypothetical protein
MYLYIHISIKTYSYIHRNMRIVISKNVFFISCESQHIKQSTNVLEIHIDIYKKYMLLYSYLYMYIPVHSCNKFTYEYIPPVNIISVAISISICIHAYMQKNTSHKNDIEINVY